MSIEARSWNSVLTNPAHTGAGQRHGQPLAQADDEGLRPGVGGAAAGDQPGDGRHVDHSAVAARHHAGECRAGQHRHRRDVDVDLALQFGLGGMQEVLAESDTGVVDQQVDRLRRQPGHHRGALFGDRQVGGDHLDLRGPEREQRRTARLQPGRITGHDHQPVAGGGEVTTECGSDAGGGAGDHGGGHDPRYPSSRPRGPRTPRPRAQAA
jgi:hypothetical protein